MSNTLCVNGWAQPPDGLAVLAPEALHLDYRACQSFEQSAGLIARLAPKVGLAIGWSLGGAILLHALAEGKLVADQLLLIAPVVQFVASPDFPCAMDSLTFNLFRANYADDPVRTAKRFAGLIAKGDRDASRITRGLGDWRGSHEKEAWLKWLDLLIERPFDLKNICSSLQMDIVHGTNDFVIPFKQSKWLAARFPQARLTMFSECGHAPHWHDLHAVRRLIRLDEPAR